MAAFSAQACNTQSKYGNNCFDSEIGHVVGSVFIGGTGTWIADHYQSQHRAWYGFLIGSAVGILGEAAEQATTSTKASPLDIAADIIGSAIGASITDKFLLMPIIHRTDNDTSVGMRVGYAF
ncbi:MAG: hypothetical protein AB7F79_07805 [Steroidobacteraceae bacterium]